MSKVVMIDYDMGNLHSVQNAFQAIGCEVEMTADPAAVRQADGVIFPGVGAFGRGMRNLAERGLIDAIREYVASGRPLLGICVGLQLLFEAGEEFGVTPGLGLLKGRITRLPSTVKLPQMGWNLVEPVRGEHPIFDGLQAPYYAYFVHSFAAEGVDPADIAAVTDYGRIFPAVVARGNLVGIQFHPEKSSSVGLRMLANWGRLVCTLKSTRPSTSSTDRRFG